MQMRHIGLLVLFLLLFVFAVANWTTIAEPTALHLLAGRVQAPFGLLMLMTVVVMGCVYAVLLLVGERRLLRENATQARSLAELRSQAMGQQSGELEEVRRGISEDLKDLRAAIDGLSRSLQSRGGADNAP